MLMLLILPFWVCGQRLDLALRAGIRYNYLDRSFEDGRFFIPFADFYNDRVTVRDVTFFRNDRFLPTAYSGGSLRYMTKNRWMFYGDIFVYYINGEVELEQRIGTPLEDKKISGVFPFQFANTAFAMNIGYKLLHKGIYIPFLAAGVAYNRNWGLEEVPITKNPFLIGLANINSFNTNFFSWNVAFGLKLLNFETIIEWQKNFTPIDSNQEEPLFLGFSSLGITLRAELFHVDLVSRKNQKLLKRIRQKF